MSSPDHHDQPLPATTSVCGNGSAPAVCARCGHALSASDAAGLGCLTCLLADGLEDGEASDAAAPALLAAGERFGDFALERDADGSPRELGHGAMGTTYLARDIVLDRPVALKVISATVATRSGTRARFLREARGAAALRHPNVASIFHYGVREADGQPFYAMEFIEGETLEERVRRHGPLPVVLAMEVTAQVARALGAAEARGLVHRDLKPSNVMLADAEDAGHAGGTLVKVIDFGLAKTVLAAGSTNPRASQSAGGFVGTPAFASPEQFAVTAAPKRAAGDIPDEGVALDVRSDIFSLGVTLWYLLTGAVPFVGRTLAEIHERQTRHPLPVEQLARAAVPAPVVALLRSLLAPDPAARPQNARELTGALRDCQQKLAAPGARRAWLLAGAVATVIGLALAAVFLLGRRVDRTAPPVSAVPAPAPAAVPEKSIAVLPFTNLSADPANAFLADGVQDEILTDLARVADLKVISRTSVMGYRDAARANLRDVGLALNVAYILEGSVAREGNQVRVTAQLIDTRTDTHVWAERYDRPVDSVFALEEEVAGQIAARLQLRLTAAEQRAINEPPTADLTAYELYLHASELATHYEATPDWRGTLEQSVRLLDEATARDPGFHRAFCLLAEVNVILYHQDLDATDPRLDRAREALAAAVRLRPDAGETHFAAALLASWGRRDRLVEATELALARERLPNDPLVFFLSGEIAISNGRWQDAIDLLERSHTLDPRNEEPLRDLFELWHAGRRYAEARRVAERGLALRQEPFFWKSCLAACALDERADPGPALALYGPLPPGHEPSADATSARFSVLWWTRDLDGAARVLAGSPATRWPTEDYVLLPRAYFEGLLARGRGDAAGARQAFLAARDEMVASAPDRTEDAHFLSVYARVDALLGRKEDALREGRSACEKTSVRLNAVYGVRILANLTRAEAWTGETDAALGHLAELVRLPYGPSYGNLRLSPDWDALRGDPRFEALCRELAPAK